MGLFSYITCDTGKPIPYKSPFTVYLVSSSGEKWKEPCYKCDGIFGGKDVFVLIVEMNWSQETRRMTEEEKRDYFFRRWALVKFPTSPFEFDFLENELGWKTPRIVENVSELSNLKFYLLQPPKRATLI